MSANAPRDELTQFPVPQLSPLAVTCADPSLRHLRVRSRHGVGAASLPRASPRASTSQISSHRRLVIRRFAAHLDAREATSSSCLSASAATCSARASVPSHGRDATRVQIRDAMAAVATKQTPRSHAGEMSARKRRVATPREVAQFRQGTESVTLEKPSGRTPEYYNVSLESEGESDTSHDEGPYAELGRASEAMAEARKEIHLAAAPSLCVRSWSTASTTASDDSDDQNSKAPDHYRMYGDDSDSDSDTAQNTERQAGEIEQNITEPVSRENAFGTETGVPSKKLWAHYVNTTALTFAMTVASFVAVAKAPRR